MTLHVCLNHPLQLRKKICIVDLVRTCIKIFRVTKKIFKKSVQLLSYVNGRKSIFTSTELFINTERKANEMGLAVNEFLLIYLFNITFLDK